MVKIVAGVILFIIVIGILASLIQLNFWSIGAVVLCLLALWFG
jgi:hypothetical protein